MFQALDSLETLRLEARAPPLYEGLELLLFKETDTQAELPDLPWG